MDNDDDAALIRGLDAFRQELRTLRRRRGLSLEAVAREVGMSTAHLSRIERGETRDPTLTIALRLAKFFGIGPSRLFMLFGLQPERRDFETDTTYQLWKQADDDTRRFVLRVSELIMLGREAEDTNASTPKDTSFTEL